MGIEPSSPYEIKSKYLEIEYKDMEAYVNLQREKLETYGCTIMFDGWTGPSSPYEIKSKYLEMEYKDMEAYVNLQRGKWETYGYTIMCDGWTRPTKLSIINFMLYSKGSTIFLKSGDTSDKIKDNKYIYGLLKDVIKEVGETNVVQIVTDNGSAFVKAGKFLM